MFGIVAEKEENSQLISEEAKLPIFGMDFFESQSENLNLSNSPQLNLATPNSYQLGPGDELEILVWGASENTYLSTINTSGYIKIDRIAPIYLSGFTVSGAKNKVKKALSKIYSGIDEVDESFTKVFFDLNLVKSRSIIINMVGSIKNSGTYTLPSVTSPSVVPVSTKVYVPVAAPEMRTSVTPEVLLAVTVVDVPSLTVLPNPVSNVCSL